MLPYQYIWGVINFGCGTGKHDIELSKPGYHCTGIDISPLMIEIARKNADSCGCDIKFEVADIRTYETEKKYDAVISLFHVMSQSVNETHKMRYFFKPELKFFLEEAGFELIDTLDCNTLGETDYNSWTSYFIAKAV